MILDLGVVRAGDLPAAMWRFLTRLIGT